MVILLQISMVLYQGLAKPGTDRMSNRIDLFNEMQILFCTDYIVLFTDFVDLQLQFKVGWAWTAILLLTLIINLTFIFYHSIRRLVLTAVKYCRLAKIKIKNCILYIKEKLPCNFDDDSSSDSSEQFYRSKFAVKKTASRQPVNSPIESELINYTDPRLIAT